MKAIIFFLVIMTYCKTVGHAIVKAKKEIPNNNNIIIVTIDGFRWQELFYGADSSILNDVNMAKNSVVAKQFFWDENIENRRRKLMPFLWSELVKKGQLFGNRKHGNFVNVSNIYSLSYPGYNEIFTGNTDLTITSNRKINNRNVSFLEYLNNKADFRGKVASFTSWNVFPFILNQQRSKLHVNSQNHLFHKALLSISKEQQVSDTRNDLTTYYLAKEYLLQKHPRVLHVGLGGTDESGHKKQYDQYLFQARLADNIIRSLWQLTQSIPFYKGRTTFIITTDHGRGNSKRNWHKHGFFVAGSSQTWMALLGNGVKKMGECKKAVQLYQKQIAGTVGYFLNVTSFSNYSLPITYFNAIENNAVAVLK